MLSFLAEGLPEGEATPDNERFVFGGPVKESTEFNRIFALPRRKLDTTAAQAAASWSSILLKEKSSDFTCHKGCKEKYGFCIRSLFPIQGHILEEAHASSGLLGLVGVGHGKTGCNILLPIVMRAKVAVLIVPSSLKSQFLLRDYPQWAEHFHVPNLVGGKWFTAGLPMLHVIGYSELSGSKNSALLTKINPDLIVADEAHSLKDRKSARTKRFLRHFEVSPTCRFVALSGTLVTRSIRDYAHLSGRALGEGSPLPRTYQAIEEWSSALDPGPYQAPAGALSKLCTPVENVRQGFCRRLIETHGVVATEEGALGTSLIIRPAKAPKVPEEIFQLLRRIRKDEERPDGEVLTDELAVAQCARQVSCGFFYRWIWPRGEPEEVIKEWLAARKEWNKEVRERLKRSSEHLDSPNLLFKAAERFHDGYDSSKGELPTWDSKHFLRWRAIKDQAEPETETVWVSDYLVKAAAEWAKTNTGIVWYEFGDFGRAVAREAGIRCYGGGAQASVDILNESGSRSIVASIKAHGTGKNLQCFDKCLVTSSPSGGAAWEQLLARIHRPGQEADEVLAEVYQHTEDMRKAFRSAVEFARFTQETTRARQKLLYASNLVDIT